MLVNNKLAPYYKGILCTTVQDFTGNQKMHRESGWSAWRTPHTPHCENRQEGGSRWLCRLSDECFMLALKPEVYEQNETIFTTRTEKCYK